MSHPFILYYLAVAQIEDAHRSARPPRERRGRRLSVRTDPSDEPTLREKVERIRVWCDSFGHEVLLPEYDIYEVERRADGDLVTFRCGCGRDATALVRGVGTSTADHAGRQRLAVAARAG